MHFTFLDYINISYKFELKEVQLQYMHHFEKDYRIYKTYCIAEHERDTMYWMMDL